MAYSNPRTSKSNNSKPAGNPGGQTRPAYAPRGGGSTPAGSGGGGASRSSGSGGGSRGAGQNQKGRFPDVEIFFGEEQVDDEGKKFYRVREVDQDGGGKPKWDKCGAIWLDPTGERQPYMKVEQDIPAGSTLVCRYNRPK